MSKRNQTTGPIGRIIDKKYNDDIPQKRGCNPLPFFGFSVIAIVIGFAVILVFDLIIGTEQTEYDTPTLPTSSPADSTRSTADMIESVSPAVVQVEAIHGFQMQQGSGVIITNTGYLITNAHVIEGADEVNIRYLNGDNALLRTEIIGIAPCSDLALLRLPRRREPYPALAFRQVFNIRPGDDVYSLGYPLNASRINANTPATRDGKISRVDININHLSGLIEHGAPINPGNSGGPLVDEFGNIIGINTLVIRDTQGLFYAIGLPVVEEIWERLVNKQSLDSKIVLTVDEPIAGRIRGIDERHCLVFDAEEGQNLILTAQGSNLDPHLWLYSPQNLYLADNDDFDRPNGDINSRIELIIPETGRYQVVIHSTGLQNSGDYSINLQLRNP